MEKIGGVFGLIGLISIIFLVSRPILQAVGDQLRKQGKKLPNPLKKFSQFVTKNHRYVGFVAAGSIALHFILQFANYGEVSVTGLIAGLALAVQAVLGFGLTRQIDKDRRKKMALLHRAWGMIIVVAVLFHRLS